MLLSPPFLFHLPFSPSLSPSLLSISLSFPSTSLVSLSVSLFPLSSLTSSNLHFLLPSLLLPPFSSPFPPAASHLPSPPPSLPPPPPPSPLPQQTYLFLLVLAQSNTLCMAVTPSLPRGTTSPVMIALSIPE